MESSIQASQGLKKGISPGHTIELVGASEGAASYIMTQLAHHALKTTESHVLYIDLEGHYRLENDQFRRFHLFYGKALLYRLASWLEMHADIHVGWIFIQATSIESSQLAQLRKLQQKWAFVLVITTNTSLAHFRFQVVETPQLGLRMIWPIQLDTVVI